MNLTGYTVSRASIRAADVFGESVSDVAALAREQLPRWTEQITSAAGGSGFVNKTAVETLLGLQHDMIFSGRRKDAAALFAEVLAVMLEGGVVASAYWVLFPLSRGSVHLASRDMADPVIDPRLNLVGFDLRAQTEVGKWTDRLWRARSSWLRLILSAWRPGWMCYRGTQRMGSGWSLHGLRVSNTFFFTPLLGGPGRQ